MSDSSPERSRATNAFPENELPKWLLRKTLGIGGRLTAGLRAPPYKPLASFSHDLAMCVGSSADTTRGLELCLKPLQFSRLGDRWSGAVDRIRNGSSLADALAPAEDLLPPFYLPVIRAGEESGRLVEALQFLEAHCSLLAGPASALRNLWFFPVVIMLFGSVARIALSFVLGSFGEGLSLLVFELIGWAQWVVIIAIAMFTPVRYFIDQARLSLPWIGPFEREIATHRFFRIMALIYSVGAHRVEEMIQTSAKTVSNSAARLDFLRAATAIEEFAPINDAFHRVRLLTDDEKASIDVGELSGTLEHSFEQISDESGASLVSKIKFIEPILFRLVMIFVTLSVISTLMTLLMRSVGI